VNLAAALAEQRHRVLLIDLDPQASASAWLGASADGRELLDVFTAPRPPRLADLAKPTAVDGLELVPGSAWLVGLDKALASEVGAETILRRALAQLPARWDVVLLDCPPSLGLLAIAALVACREVLVPVEARVMALAGLAALVQTVERVQERLNPELAISGILACRVDTRTNLSHDVVARLRERFGRLVLSTVIRETVRLAEAPSFQQPITVYASDSAGAEDYRAAAREFAKSGPQKGRRTK
jgi:chromosome partitioning protein